MFHSFPFDRVRPLMLRVVIGSLIAAAAVAIFAIATAGFSDTSWKLLGTTALFTAFALFSWYDADVSAKRSERFALVSFAVSAYLFAAGMVKLWGPETGRSDYWEFEGFFGWVVLAAVARIALLHTHYILNTRAKFESAVIAVVTNITLLLVVVLAIMLSVPVLVDFEPGDGYWRAVGVFAVLDVLGTVLIPLGYALFTHTTNPAGLPTPATAPAFRPPGAAYAAAGTPLTLKWPAYSNGSPLPTGADGHPDFTGVLGYDMWRDARNPIAAKHSGS